VALAENVMRLEGGSVAEKLDVYLVIQINLTLGHRGLQIGTVVIKTQMMVEISVQNAKCVILILLRHVFRIVAVMMLAAFFKTVVRTHAQKFRRVLTKGKRVQNAYLQVQKKITQIVALAGRNQSVVINQRWKIVCVPVKLIAFIIPPRDNKEHSLLSPAVAIWLLQAITLLRRARMKALYRV
tara:strand:- start:408 stop:956 length:549 start_codon:yes stop_codon:yes gene_type:complete